MSITFLIIFVNSELLCGGTKTSLPICGRMVVSHPKIFGVSVHFSDCNTQEENK